jgi:hypothetical protein
LPSHNFVDGDDVEGSCNVAFESTTRGFRPPLPSCKASRMAVAARLALPLRGKKAPS